MELQNIIKRYKRDENINVLHIQIQDGKGRDLKTFRRKWT